MARPQDPGASDDPTATVGPSERPLPAEPGTLVGGRYIPIERVGAGGMGSVVRAYDSRLLREVALKRLHAKAIDDEAEGRFIREAQAMAQLSHPNVVEVYDVAVDLASGGLVIAMEYVPGTTLRRWIAQGPRPWRDTVETFRRAGAGVAAAHRQGIVHRDFKPSNVLVSSDGPGIPSVVKVTDFGLAKTVHEPPSEPGSNGGSNDPHSDPSNRITRRGMVMGTPKYMAPEQHAGEETTNAADQYAFCVSLWQALCGESPFSGNDVVAAKLRGPPAWPTDSPVSSEIARAIRRGLCRRPAQRWRSMAALLEAIEVRTPSRRYGAVIGAGGVAVVTVAGVAWWQRQRDDRCSGAQELVSQVWSPVQRARGKAAFAGTELIYAADTWHRVEEALDGYASAWSDQHRRTCEATAVRGEQSATELDLRMACLERARSALEAAVQVFGEADRDVVLRAMNVVGRLPSLMQCDSGDGLRADPSRPQDPRLAGALAELRGGLAGVRILRAAGKYEQARMSADRLVNEAEALGSTGARAEAKLLRGRVLFSMAQHDAAEDDLRAAGTLALRSGQWSTAAEAKSSLALAVAGRGQVRPGLALGRVARRLARNQDPGGSLEVDVLSDVAGVLSEAGRHAESAHMVQQALRLLERNPSPPPMQLSQICVNLGGALALQGNHAGAEEALRRGLEIKREFLGPRHPSVAFVLNNLAVVSHHQGRHVAAESFNREALALREEALGLHHPDVGMSMTNLANVLDAQGRFEEAEPVRREALRIWTKAFGDEHPRVAGALTNLASTLTSLGRRDEAARLSRQALSIMEKGLGPEHPNVAIIRHNLATSSYRQGRLEEARSEAARALEIRVAAGVPPAPIGRTADLLADILWDLGRPVTAREVAAQAQAAYQEAGAPAADSLTELERRWAERRTPGVGVDSAP